MGKPKPRLINCSHCGEEFYFLRSPIELTKYKQHFCPDCVTLYYHQRKHGYAIRDEFGRQANEYEMWKDAKKRSINQNVPFDIEPSDIIIPKNCPALGIPLIRQTEKPSDNSPTLDKIIPEKGYVKNNIVVISYKANAMKRNATLEEIFMLSDFYKRIYEVMNDGH